MKKKEEKEGRKKARKGGEKEMERRKRKKNLHSRLKPGAFGSISLVITTDPPPQGGVARTIYHYSSLNFSIGPTWRFHCTSL